VGSTAQPNTSGGDSGLSTGVLIAVIAGCVVVVLALAAFVMSAMRRRQLHTAAIKSYGDVATASHTQKDELALAPSRI